MLNDILKDLDLQQARERIDRELSTEKARMDALLAKALHFGHLILSQEAAREIFIEGQSNILDEPEFSRIEQLKAEIETAVTEQEKRLRAEFERMKEGAA